MYVFVIDELETSVVAQALNDNPGYAFASGQLLFHDVHFRHSLVGYVLTLCLFACLLRCLPRFENRVAYTTVMSTSVCLSVCLSVCEHISETTRPNFARFLCMLPLAVARSDHHRPLAAVLISRTCLL